MDPRRGSLRNVDRRRDDYIEWEDYFMAMAVLAAKRSKDPCSKVGASIVNQDKQIVGIGYIGMPIGCGDFYSWSNNDKSSIDSKDLYVCHAEMNAILNKNVPDLKGCSIYVGLFPCNECVKMIIQSGIKAVYYLSEQGSETDANTASKIMFKEVGVDYKLYIPKKMTFEIDFEEIDWNNLEKMSPEAKI